MFVGRFPSICVLKVMMYGTMVGEKNGNMGGVK